MAITGEFCFYRSVESWLLDHVSNLLRNSWFLSRFQSLFVKCKRITYDILVRKCTIERNARESGEAIDAGIL